MHGIWHHIDEHHKKRRSLNLCKRTIQRNANMERCAKRELRQSRELLVVHRSRQISYAREEPLPFYVMFAILQTIGIARCAVHAVHGRTHSIRPSDESGACNALSLTLDLKNSFRARASLFHLIQCKCISDIVKCYN